MDVLIHQLADLALKKLEARKPESPKPTEPVPALETQKPREPSASPRGRHIPAAIQRAVWKREGGRCSYQDAKTGRICHTPHALQYEHLQPFAWGGEHSLENLTLMSGA